MQAESAICSMAALINILSAEYPGNKIYYPISYLFSKQGI